MYYHKLQLPDDDWFFKLNKQDLLTGERFVVHDEIVVCKKCKACYKRSTWDSLPDHKCLNLGCGAVNCTLADFSEDFFEIPFGGRRKPKTFHVHEQETKTFIMQPHINIGNADSDSEPSLSDSENLEDSSSEDDSVETEDVNSDESTAGVFIIKGEINHPIVASTATDSSGGTFIIRERHYTPYAVEDTTRNNSGENDDAVDQRYPIGLIILYFLIGATLVAGLSVGYYYLWKTIFEVTSVYNVTLIISMIVSIGGGISVFIIFAVYFKILIGHENYVKTLLCAALITIGIYIAIFFLFWGISALVSIWSN